MLARTIVVALLSLAIDAQATSLHKCTSANGRIEYRDRPCDAATPAAAAQRVTVQENTSGAGEDLASIRARDAQFNARQDAKRAAQDRAEANERAAAQRAFSEERAHRDRQALVDAVREGNAQNNVGYWPYYQRPHARSYYPPSKPAPQPGIAVGTVNTKKKE